MTECKEASCSIAVNCNRCEDNVVKVLENLMLYFTSANEIPVERATILTKSKEIQDIKNLLESMKR